MDSRKRGHGKVVQISGEITLRAGAQEMKDIMRQAGFEEVAVFGDLDGNEYGIDANRLISISRKSP
jgi:hypothetical protein